MPDIMQEINDLKRRLSILERSPQIDESLLVPDDDTAPAAPSSVLVTPGFESVSITWYPNVESDMQLPFGTYRVEVATDDTFDTIVATSSGSVTSAFLTDLAAETDHWARVYAIDAQGNESDPAGDYYFVPLTPIPDSSLVPNDGIDPATPTGLTVQPGIESMNITWDANAEIDMVPPWGTYRVEFSTDDFATDPISEVVTPATFLFAAMAGLGGLTMYARVIAVDAHGNESAPSASGSTTIIAAPDDNVGIPSVVALPTLPDPDYPEDYVVVLSTDGKLYKVTGGAWEPVVRAIDLDGQITETQITNDAVTTVKIAALAITAAKIAAGTITTNELAANTILAADIAAGTITATEIAAATITASRIAALTITANEIAANTITAAKIVAGTITATEIAASTITGAKIAAGTITATNIQGLTITAAEIAAATITGAKIAADTISASNLAALTLGVGKYIESTSYVAGTSGWHIDAAGDAEFNDVTLRGELIASRITIAEGANIVPAADSTFESGSIAWTNTGAGTIDRQNSNARTGSWSLRLTTVSTPGNNPTGQLVMSNPTPSSDKIFRINLWIRADASNATSIRIRTKDGSGSFITATNWTTLTAGSGYQEFVVYAKVTAGNDLTLEVGTRQSPAGSGFNYDLRIDDVSVVPVGGVTNQLSADSLVLLTDPTGDLGVGNRAYNDNRYRKDSDKKQVTGGAFGTNSTSYVTPVGGPGAISVEAEAGDKLWIYVSARWAAATAVFCRCDVLCNTSGNYISGAGSSGNGVSAWQGMSSLQHVIGGGILYTVVSGDISSGLVELIFRMKVSSGTTRNLDADANNIFEIGVINTGPGRL